MTEPMTKPFLKENAPWLIVASFALLAVIVFLFRLPEGVTAVLFVLLFFGFTWKNPVNKTAFLILSAPFFLGAQHRPYFFLYEIFLYGTLISGGLHLFLRKTSPAPPYKPLVILLGLAALFSLPLDLKEVYLHFWAASSSDIGFQFIRGYENAPLFPLRALANFLSGLFLFILTASLFREAEGVYVEKVMQAAVALSAGICLVGLAILYGFLPSYPRTYLSLSLIGIHEGALSALAFNRQYLAQFLLLLFPLTLFLLYRYRYSRLRFLYGASVFLFLFCLTATMQRSAFMVLGLEGLGALLSLMNLHRVKGKRLLLLFSIPFIAAALMLLLDGLFLEQRFLNRFLLWGFSDPDQRRLNLWTTAWHMFTASPFLGVGLGRYAGLFPYFFSSPNLSWKTFGTVRGEPHSFYFQVLSEQGCLGLFFFALLIGTVFYGAVRTIKRESSTDRKAGLLALLNVLAAWLLLGFFHNPAYIRSLGVLFWIFLGWTAAFSEPASPAGLGKKYGGKGFIAALGLLTAALAFQIFLISTREPSPEFQAGVYAQESHPDGSLFRWTGRRAAFYRPLRGETIVLTLSAPLPEIAYRPQRITLIIGDRRYLRELKDEKWHRFEFASAQREKDKVLIRLKVSRVFNPRQAGLGADSRDLGVMIRED